MICKPSLRVTHHSYFKYFINPSTEYLIPIWWPSVSKIVQKHCGTRISHCSFHCKTVSNYFCLSEGATVTKGGRGLPIGQLGLIKSVIAWDQGYVQAHKDQGYVWCPKFCYGYRVERHVSWKRCAMGFEIRFLLFGRCVKNGSPISSNVCRNHAVLKRLLAQWVQVKSFNMCPLQLGIGNNWRY